MVASIRNLASARDLMWAWTGRNIRARYQQSALGWLWAVIQPAAQVAIFSVIFTLFVPVDTGNVPYVIFSYVAVAPWTFLASALTDMSNALVFNMSLVTKIYFPREALPIAAMLARLMDFGIAVILLILMMVYFRMPISGPAMLYLPAILAVQLALLLGLGFACAALNVFYRDVQSLLVLALQVWFYASPIIYPTSLVPAWLRPYYYLNPMAGVLEAYRDVLLRASTPGPYLATAAVVSAVLLLGGYWFFKRVEFRFADVV